MNRLTFLHESIEHQRHPRMLIYSQYLRKKDNKSCIFKEKKQTFQIFQIKFSLMVNKCYQILTVAGIIFLIAGIGGFTIGRFIRYFDVDTGKTVQNYSFIGFGVSLVFFGIAYMIDKFCSEEHVSDNAEKENL